MGLSSSSQTLCLYVYSECQMQNVLPDFRNEIIIIFKMMFRNISHFAYNNYIFIFIIFYFNFYIVRVCLFCEEKQQHLFFCSKQMWTKPISIPYNHQMTMIIILMTMLLLLLFFSFNNKQKNENILIDWVDFWSGWLTHTHSHWIGLVLSQFCVQVIWNFVVWNSHQSRYFYPDNICHTLHTHVHKNVSWLTIFSVCLEMKMTHTRPFPETIGVFDNHWMCHIHGSERVHHSKKPEKFSISIIRAWCVCVYVCVWKPSPNFHISIIVIPFFHCAIGYYWIYIHKQYNMDVCH